MPLDSARDIKAQTLAEAAGVAAAAGSEEISKRLMKMAEETLGHDSFSPPSRRSVDIADRALREALQARVAAGREQAVSALAKLVNWVPGFYGTWPLAYQSFYTSRNEKKEVRKRVQNAPFFSEAWTYELFGKEQARTLLSLIEGVATALGVSADDLVNEKERWGDFYVSPEAQKRWDEQDAWRAAFRKARKWWDRLQPKSREKFARQIFPGDAPFVEIACRDWDNLGAASGGNSCWRATITRWHRDRPKKEGKPTVAP